MNVVKFTRFVAPIIATITVLFGITEVRAQAQPFVWGPENTTKMIDYKIDRISVPFGSQNIAYNHRVAVVESSMVDLVMSEPQFLDSLADSCRGDTGCLQVNWVRSGKEWSVFKLGTPGTVAVSRFYMPNLNSHVFVAANEILEGQNALIVLRGLSDDFRDEGEKFAVIPPLRGYVEGKLPLSQACGDERQTGLTAMVRVYNKGASKPSSSVSMAVRFNDGNHLFTTRSDAQFMVDTRRVPGWEIASRDTDDTARAAGVWCVPSVTQKIIQTTTFSNAPGDGSGGIWIQAQEHNVLAFAQNGPNISLPTNVPLRHATKSTADQTGSGRFSVNPNTGVISLVRANGGFVVYGRGEPEVAPKAGLQMERGWSAIAEDQETGVVYGLSVNTTIKVHAYNPVTNTYLWQYEVPESYRQYVAGETGLYIAGNNLVFFLQHFTNSRDVFKGALFAVPLLSSGATPEVRIIGLPGPNNRPVSFVFDASLNVGIFADARDQSLIYLNFNDWSMTKEQVPFQPFALLKTLNGDLYATHVPRGSDMSYVFTEGSLWKRGAQGGWQQVATLGKSPVDLSLVVINGTQQVMTFNRACGTVCSVIDLIDLKTGRKNAWLSRDVDVFGLLNWRDGLSSSSLHQ